MTYYIGYDIYHKEKKALKRFEGRVVSGLFVSDCNHYMKIEIENTDSVIFVTAGDCCSESWFADVIDADEFIGGTLGENPLEAAEGFGDPNDGRCRQDEDAIYGFNLVSDKGLCKVAFRCSSNGYYGGTIELYEKDDLKGTNWIQIKNEWPA